MVWGCLLLREGGCFDQDVYPRETERYRSTRGSVARELKEIDSRKRKFRSPSRGPRR